MLVVLGDHGEQLGSHGGLFQKWSSAYDETVRVPFMIHNPVLFDRAEQAEVKYNTMSLEVQRIKGTIKAILLNQNTTLQLVRTQLREMFDWTCEAICRSSSSPASCSTRNSFHGLSAWIDRTT